MTPPEAPGAPFRRSSGAYFVIDRIASPMPSLLPNWPALPARVATTPLRYGSEGCSREPRGFCADTDSILRNNGISRLVFSGGLTDACVASSVREAYDRGYLCTVAEDACLTSSSDDHEAALRSLAKFFGWVTSTDQIIAALQH
jgi:nicotinamidase-related amidase